ncbi:signal peptidase I [Nocardioides coralli]|uniref:signal peptidase I n=1 Tax=Nocardioides coralli TaxID=2872154 RepID=UPI001CA3C9D7|nr:signal peptidase I [Nocardioides coralli]QZY28762.1 signal peptidase I [Nocardioides coralli]
MPTTDLTDQTAAVAPSAPVKRRLWGRVASVLATTVVASAVLLALAVPIAPRILGWDIMIISTPSMEPTYPVGTLTFVKPVTAADVEVGTPLVFTSPTTSTATVTHRVVELVPVEGVQHFRTQGDANDTADAGLVPPRDVVGEVAFDVPRLGWVVDRLQRDPTLLMGLVAIPAGLIIAGELRNLRRNLGSTSRRRPDEEEQ